MKNRSLLALLVFVLLAGFQTLPAFSQAKPSEEQKIKMLIEYVRTMEGATFIRNGSEYSAPRAAEHLALKRENAGSKIKTAQDFIKYLATKSSFSGEPYYIRFKNGKTYPSGEVLKKQLQQIENKI